MSQTDSNTTHASVAADWDYRLTDEPAATAELAARIKTRMDGIPFAPDPLPTPLRPIVLSPAAQAGLVTGAQRLASLLVETAQRRCADPIGLQHATGHPSADLLLLPRDWSRWAHLTLRPDVVFSGGKPQFLEANFHSALGGLQAVAALAEAQLGCATTGAAGQIGQPPNPIEARRAMLEDVGHRHTGRQELRVVLTGYDHECDFETDHFQAEVECLLANGASSTLVRPSEIDFDGSVFRAADGEFDCCLRLFSSDEAAIEGARFGALQQAVEAQTAPVLSDDHCSLYGNKIVLAWLSEDAERQSDANARFVREQVPWTRVIADVPAQHGDKEVELLDYVERNREQFVLKPAHSRGSDGVVFGHATDEATWRSTIEHYVGAGTRGVVQAYAKPDRFPVALYGPTGSVSFATLPIVFGVYLMGGEFGGALARVATRAHDGAIGNAGAAGVVYTTVVVAP